VARADAARVNAQRAASQADAAAVTASRRVLREAQLASRAAAAQVRAARARVSAERMSLGTGSVLPLDGLRSRHESVLARWIAYETDPGLAVAYPAMSDARQSYTAAFLVTVERARDRRPAETGRVTASDYSLYRQAVDDLEHAFDLAERAARGERVQQDLPDALWEAARGFAERSTDVLNRTAELLGEWTSRRRER
jgi:hypothetical protein